MKPTLEMDDLHVGMTVNVHASVDSPFTNDFTGTIVNLEPTSGLVQVRDQDDDVWSCELWELSFNSDDYIH